MKITKLTCNEICVGGRMDRYTWITYRPLVMIIFFLAKLVKFK